MKLILIGPPGAGKGTQAEIIKERLGLTHISTGDMLRAAKSAGTELGKKVASIMAEGKLVSDDIIISLVKERIAQPDCEKGFMLDGFPRTVAQAEALEKNDVKIDNVVMIEVPDSTLISRLTGRRIDRDTGKIYNVTTNPPPESANVYQRDDDNETSVRKRLVAYHEQTAPVIAHYEEKGLVKRINGVGELGEITARVMDALGAQTA